MVCDISMENSSTVAPADFMPRKVLDHMNPFFFKAHSHSHQHPHHHHHHQHRHHHPQHLNNLKSTTATTSSIHASSAMDNTLLSNSTATVTTESTTSTTADAKKEFIYPTPRRLSAARLEATSVSYNTPPATPPLQHTQPTPLAWCTARARIPTPDGSEYFLHIYENTQDKKEHMAFVFGDAIRSLSLDRPRAGETELDRVKRGAYVGRLKNIADSSSSVSSYTDENFVATAVSTTTTALSSQDVEMDSTMDHNAPLVRIHSECFTGEIGHSARCDCGEQLDEAIRLMKEQGSGVVVYLRQEGRGIGLAEKLKAYNIQDLGYDTVAANLMLNHGADERTYEVAQAILQDLGLQQIRLLTNNPDKIEQVEKDSDIQVVERVAMVPKSWEAIEQGINLEVKEGAVENKIVRGKELDKYLKVKVERMRHIIDIPTVMQQ